MFDEMTEVQEDVKLFDVSDDFPIEALPSPAKELAMSISATKGVPVQLPAMTALSACAVCMGNDYSAVGAVEGYASYANLYIMAVAESSTGKGASDSIISPIQDHEREHCRPKSESLIVENITGEALFHKMSLRKSLFSFSTEAGGALDITMGLYKGSGNDYDKYNKAWSSESIRVTRMSSDDIYVDEPSFNVYWALQHSYYKKLALNNLGMLSGFIPRFLCFEATAKKLKRTGRVAPPLNKGAQGEWNGILNVLLHRLDIDCQGERALKYSKKATATMDLFYDEIVDIQNADSAMLLELGKMCEIAIRVSLVLSIMENTDAKTISEKNAKCAIEIVKWCVNSSRGMGNVERYSKLEARYGKLMNILAKKGGEATTRILEKNHGFKRNEIEAISLQFPDIEWVEKKTGGRPTTVVKIVGGEE